jgi:cytochrome subunit of sulfide dehydrogenase
MMKHSIRFNDYLIALLVSVGLPSIGWSAEVTSPNTNPHIRTLAASCAACHGTDGNSMGVTPTLAGLDLGYFTAQMLAFKDGSHASTVMHHHAKGLQVDEINALAYYFSQQKRATSKPASTQTLKADHGD